MNGKRTCIVLGAGASRCYEGVPNGVPTQQDIVGRLFFHADVSDGEGFPSWTDTFGLRHSFALATHLRKRFNLTESSASYSKLDFWQVLQGRGFTLETLYAALQEDPEFPPALLEDFEAIVRAAVSEPLDDRAVEHACAYHRQICEALEPGDYIVNFNWDALMADALLYYSHFWFPGTGFGVPVEGMLIDRRQKALPVESLVHLLQVHGSTVLFQRDDDNGSANQRGVVYVGPKKWSPMTGMMLLAKEHGLDPSTAGGVVVPISDEESRRLRHQWLRLRKRWFRPVFVPPSHHKAEYRSWYAKAIRARLHTALPSTQVFVVAGYSLPPADLPHIQHLFVPEVQSEAIEVVVVNPANDDPAFRERWRHMFPNTKGIDFATRDFRDLCGNLLSKAPERPAGDPSEPAERLASRND